MSTMKDSLVLGSVQITSSSVALRLWHNHELWVEEGTVILPVVCKDQLEQLDLCEFSTARQEKRMNRWLLEAPVAASFVEMVSLQVEIAKRM
jgi:hypothetical protein